MQFSFNLCDEPPLSSAERKLDLLLYLTGITMQTQAQQTAAIEALATKAEKVKAEILAAVTAAAAAAQAALDEVKAQLATAGQSTPAMDAALSKADTALTELDALNPDPAPAPVPPVGTI